MRRRQTTALRTGGLLLLLASGTSGSLLGQESRDSLVAKAFREYDTRQRLRLLTAALDPDAGPPTGPWAAGVQLLAQTLLEERQDSLAAVWLRWAVRVSPDLQVDTAQFLPEVAVAHHAAQEFVRRTQTPGDSLATTTWSWPAPGSLDQLARLQVSGPATGVGFGVAVERIGPVEPGATTTMEPGSYAIGAGAPGHDSLKITREALPGVTTRVELRLAPKAPVAAVPPKVPAAAVPPKVPVAAAPPADQGRRPKPPPLAKKKKFPWALAALGAVGAGAVVVLAGGGSDGDSKGSITVTFPGE